MQVQVAILAAGLGTRLGKPHPKPLTRLSTGQSIMERQIGSLRGAFGADARILTVVGYKMDLIVEAHPDVLFAYNEAYDSTNTSKSLLKALRLSNSGGVLWMNGDVVFDERVLDVVGDHIRDDRSFVCVNTDSVAEEEVKYTLDDRGMIAGLSKQVEGALGEAVGINFVAGKDKAALITRLDECDDTDYFEYGIELAIQKDGLAFEPVDISEFPCVEVDFEADLGRANAMLAR
jgi:choline kinase